ncbi:chromosome segregation protein SMC [Pontibacillus litoralis]|uniref:Chromosome partition protein Smc n=1 Tax=Pontibacillus litoralis JSM 072002 TaxID=1385512 RepID=A0A0A5HXZ6_9BACI|nr:chromosome segregation protein SMC [Pontibacillus litoralis]KGX88477.1 chromosome partitioning protein Smc [Pontibacillus litoralis JSM 072002]
MFLKRLDTVGFKSFADRVTVDFVPGVTAVVGPNGSGKSNITDAVRWVLGEQSAKSLRGAKMEDVIFSGSETRNGLNFAEVTLVLNNEDETLPLDYQEVSITRRVYRSGESEFYINKQACRLKDIVELFMDSGLGREAFSIISQGKVEEILSSKAEDRRTIFEEAAGVLKYKQRKKKAEYKLAETQENLNRVEDIVYEIDNQLEPLKEQSAIAKDYLEKKEELEQYEVSLLASEIETLHEQWENLLAIIAQQKDSESKVSSSMKQEEATIEEERSRIHDLDESIEQLQESLLIVTQELENLEGKKELFSERQKHFTENRGKLLEDVATLEERMKQLEDTYQQEMEKQTEFEQKRDETKAKQQQVKQKLAQLSENQEEVIEELKSDYIEYLNEQAAKRNERKSIQQQLDQTGMKNTRLEDKFKGMLQERQALQEQKKAAHSDVEAITAKSEHLKQKLEELQVKLEQLQGQYEENQSKLYKGYQHIEKIRSKKEMLDEMKEDFAGFYQGVKEVLKARQNQQLTGIEGAVAELIDIPNEYMMALETTLGAQAQHIVVQSEQHAREAIKWLKKHNKGRATFLPLSTIQSRYVPNERLSAVRSHQGFVGVAAELIRYNKKYDHVIKHLLGHVLISKTLKDANDIAAATGRKYRIVTLDGDVVNPGGSMTGGAQKKSNQSLFTRDKELKELEDRLYHYEERARQFESEVQQRKEQVASTENQYKELRKQLDVCKEEEQQAKSKLRELELKMQNLNDHLHLYDQDKAQFASDEQSLKARSEALYEELLQIEQKLQSIQQQIDQATALQNTQKESKAQLQQDLHQLHVMLAEQQTKVENQVDKTISLQKQLQELKGAYSKQNQQLEQFNQMIESGETKQEIDNKIEEKRKQKASNNELIQLRRAERQERFQFVEDAERNVKETKRNHKSLVQDIQDKEVKANRLDVELENRLERLRTEYMLTFEKAKATYSPVEDIEATKTKVKLIKRGIEELGTVNIGAIDEYERISERYTFLTEQQNDLLDAKSTLYNVIAEMDEEMERRFEHTFSQIKEKFTVVFRELFGGGKADLRLTDPDNILETGIDIVAQPPGKKLQHLGLLSGGERALTAIALLFAILKVRPVPFCILDEVEAALDEANVNRFAQYLKAFSEHTQFIVITHRKGTMEEADVLYGVTMQESGVSKLVSVRLEETKDLVQGNK